MVTCEAWAAGDNDWLLGARVRIWEGAAGYSHEGGRCGSFRLVQRGPVRGGPIPLTTLAIPKAALAKRAVAAPCNFKLLLWHSALARCTRAHRLHTGRLVEGYLRRYLCGHVWGDVRGGLLDPGALGRWFGIENVIIVKGD